MSPQFPEGWTPPKDPGPESGGNDPAILTEHRKANVARVAKAIAERAIAARAKAAKTQ